MRKLIDAKYGHEVASISNDRIVSRWGHVFQIQGYSVLDADEDVVGTLMDGYFLNRYGTLMAVENANP